MASIVPEQLPAVSIIIATYNLSHILGSAITSVLRSSFTDWEIIVVGDACTDDTARCVSGFNDSRIRFVNMPERCGDQSAPNNHGVALARGRFLAFLNHDDIFLPDHLATCVDELEKDASDLVWTSCAFATPNPNPSATELPCRFELRGVPDVTGYSPFSIYLASSWVFRRTLVDRVGKWRSSDRLYVSPSQDWFFRAWRSGALMRFIPMIGVIAVPRGHRPNSYARGACADHEWLDGWMKDNPSYREIILAEAGLAAARNYATALRDPSMMRLLAKPLFALLIAMGIHPASLAIARREVKPGALSRSHRRRTGAPLRTEKPHPSGS